MNLALDHPIIWIPAIGFFLALVAFFGARKTRGGARIGLAITGTVLVLLPAWLLVAAFAPGGSTRVTAPTWPSTRRSNPA